MSQHHRRPARRARLLLAGGVLFALLAVAALAWWVWARPADDLAVEPGTYVAPSSISTSTPAAPRTTTSPRSRSTTSATPRIVAQPSGEPRRIQVVSDGTEIIDTTLEPTLLDAQKVLAPPFGTAGWYAEKGWPKPGYDGASIIVGHINRGSDPDVFWNLPQVAVGDVATVTYSSGEKVAFAITRSRAASKTEVPQDDSIWDYDNPKPRLRLITCDPTTPLQGGHYEGNWVVWADRQVPA